MEEREGLNFRVVLAVDVRVRLAARIFRFMVDFCQRAANFGGMRTRLPPGDKFPPLFCLIVYIKGVGNFRTNNCAGDAYRDLRPRRPNSAAPCLYSHRRAIHTCHPWGANNAPAQRDTLRPLCRLGDRGVASVGHTGFRGAGGRILCALQ